MERSEAIVETAYSAFANEDLISMVGKMRIASWDALRMSLICSGVVNRNWASQCGLWG
jgi:hypothetical protein